MNRDADITRTTATFSGTDPDDFAESSTTCGSTLSGRTNRNASSTLAPHATGKSSAVLDGNGSAAGSPRTVSSSGTGK